MIELGEWVHDLREEGGPNLGFEEDGAKDAKLPLLVFVVALVSGIDILHGTTRDTAGIDVDALSTSTGTLEANAVCSGKVCEPFVQEVAGPSCVDRTARDGGAGRDVETTDTFWIIERYWAGALRI